MVIKVVNISDSESLSYPLALLKGEISPPCSCNSIQLINDTTGEKRYWPVSTNSHFYKAFVSLRPGNNKVSLRCHHNRVHLTFTYRPPLRHRRVRLIYIVCPDDPGHFQAPEGSPCDMDSAIRRITLGVRLLQSFVAEKLWEQNLGRRTFQLVENSDNLHPDNLLEAGHEADCYIHKTSLSVQECWGMTGDQLWVHFAKELARDLPDDLENTKWLAFMSFTRYSVPLGANLPRNHHDVMRFTQGHCALGGGGLALFGSGSLHAWAESLDDFVSCMTDCRTINRANLMDDSAFRGYYWANYSTGLGSVLHELGHTFDLTHTDDGIMCRGGDDINLSLCLPPSSGQGCGVCSGHPGINRTNLPDFVPPPETNRHLNLVQIETSFIVTPTLTFNPSPKHTLPVPLAEPKLPCPSLPPASPIWPKFGHCTSVFHDGKAFWTRSNAVFLANHRWFLDDSECSPSSQDPTTLRIERTMLVSKYGLRIIEFRSPATSPSSSRVLAHIEFPETSRSASRSLSSHLFTLHTTSLYTEALSKLGRSMDTPCERVLVMVAEDSRGSLCKARIFIGRESCDTDVSNSVSSSSPETITSSSDKTSLSSISPCSTTCSNSSDLSPT